MAKTDLTAERLRELLAYDQATGKFTWLKASNKRWVGCTAGSKQKEGIGLHIDGDKYLAHRLAWLHCYGELPCGYIEHINHDVFDNRICNLAIQTSLKKVRISELSIAEVKKILHYDPETGVFTWTRTSKQKKFLLGANAGCKGKHGYVLVRVMDTLYKAHRLAWFYMTGEWPKQVIDHKDGNPNNNRFDNLRDVSPEGNVQNQRRANKTNLLGVLGVSKVGERFYSTIYVKGKSIHLGAFDTPELAHQAYLEAKRIHHPTCTI